MYVVMQTCDHGLLAAKGQGIRHSHVLRSVSETSLGYRRHCI